MMNRDVLHTQVQASRSAVIERGQERQVAVQVGRSFGFDLRPSRLFVWAGAEREGHERDQEGDRRDSSLLHPLCSIAK